MNLVMQYILQELKKCHLTEKNKLVFALMCTQNNRNFKSTYNWFSYCNAKMQRYNLFRKFPLKCFQKSLT